MREPEIRPPLIPLGREERPLGITLAAGFALAIALANLIAALAGAGSGSPALGLAFAAMMLLAATGLWLHNLFAVIAFEVLLGIGIVYAALSLLFASSVAGLLIAVAVIAVCTPIFWLLVRVIARLIAVPPE
jgi:hypothetical protein